MNRQSVENKRPVCRTGSRQNTEATPWWFKWWQWCKGPASRGTSGVRGWQSPSEASHSRRLKRPGKEESVPWVLWESEPEEGLPCGTIALEQCWCHRHGADTGKKHPTSLSKFLTQHCRNLFHRQTHICTQNMTRNVLIIAFFITKNLEIILMCINTSNDDVGKDYNN